MSESIEIIHELAKQRHDDRVAKTPSRIAYDMCVFDKYNISYELKDENTGHFVCRNIATNRKVLFWASTGLVKCWDEKKNTYKKCGRGIDDCIHACGIEVMRDE